MPLPELIRKSAEKILSRYCEEKIPPCARQQLRLVYQIRDDNATLYEERPLLSDPERWLAAPIAQFRFNHELRQWSLHVSDRNHCWHLYANIGPTLNLSRLLQHLDEDPFRIFWG